MQLPGKSRVEHTHTHITHNKIIESIAITVRQTTTTVIVT